MKNLKLTKEIQKLSFWFLSEYEVAGALETNIQEGLSLEEIE